MTTAYAVIGSQYGDEGKGLAVDWLAHQHGGPSAVVVRTNGGSQAGHTVVTPEGQRHVFSHFGSGSFTGARTHLSRFMIVNPIKFREERMRLMAQGCRAPRVTVDPNAMVTLPFDMMINQIVEIVRGNARHGSCGHGIGETVERNEHAPGFPITVADLKGKTLEQFAAIRDEWVPRRLEQLGVTEVPEQYRGILYADEVLSGFINECNSFNHLTEIFPDEEIPNLGTVVFEGAQGLALDQTIGAFPFVTRSNTGLKNMVALAELAGISAIETHYMTRCYTTRHGAGPLAHEQDVAGEIAVNDPTNVPNDWQGTLRFAPLDVDFMMGNCQLDLASVSGSKVRVGAYAVVTCLDQIKDSVSIYRDGSMKQYRAEDAHTAFDGLMDGPVFVSYGPTRNDLRST